MKISGSLFQLPFIAAFLVTVCACERSSGLPTELTRIPQDLKNEKLELQGIYEDGWIAEKAACSLEQPEKAQFLTIRGMVPIIAGNSGFRTDLALSIDGQNIGRRGIGPGEFEFSAPIARGTGKRRLSITFSEAQILPAGDGRLVGARLEFIGFVETPAAGDIVYSPKVQLGNAWGVLESFGGEKFRWVENDAELLVEAPRPSPVVLSLLVEPGSGIGARTFELKLVDAAGNVVGVQRVDGQRMVYFTLSAVSGTQNRFRLHTDAGGKQSATDPRILNFRVFKIELR